jgi:hypothetical protein
VHYYHWHCFTFTIFFQFASKLFTLFFERVHATRPVVPFFPARSMLDVCMCMWGNLMPNKGQFKFPIFAVGKDVCDLLASEDNHVLNIV